jgi:hypothetical protein
MVAAFTIFIDGSGGRGAFVRLPVNGASTADYGSMPAADRQDSSPPERQGLDLEIEAKNTADRCVPFLDDRRQ